MLKEHEIKEPTRVKAGRRWANADVRKRVKQREKEPKLVDPDAKPEIGEVIENEGRRDGRVNRFESKFKRDIRMMMEGQAKLNLQIYAIRLEHRRRILLKEKLRRLKLAQQNNGG